MTDVINLISQTITLDQLGNEVAQETSRQVYCEINSIGQSEFFAAENTQLNPEYRFTVFFADYEGEEIVKYNGARFVIYRTYRTGDNLELYVERKIGA